MTTLIALLVQGESSVVDRLIVSPAFTSTARLQLRAWLAGLGALQPEVVLLSAHGRALDARDALTLLLWLLRALGHMLARSAALWSACISDVFMRKNCRC
jgi:hypothetical protein